MVQFWLDDVKTLLNPDNFDLNNLNPTDKKIKILNIIALASLVAGLYMCYRKKDPKYFLMSVGVMSFTIFLKPQNGNDSFSKVSSQFTKIESALSNSFDTGAYLVKNANGDDQSGLNNILYINQSTNINKGDIIALSVNNVTLETNIVSDVKFTTNENLPVLILLNPLKNNYPKSTTKILKVSDNSPGEIPPPNGNISIQNAQNVDTNDPLQMAAQNFPKFNLPNQSKNDWNLEQSTIIPNQVNPYTYQGQPYGNLKARLSDVNNPMGTINVTEYDSPPTMYGTVNVGDYTNGVLNDNIMTSNQEATVSQRVDDLLFHRGNSQMMFSPMPVDTLPDNQDAFANWVYNSPTNLVNVKYASIFVNEPEKYKAIARLAKATGTENGGGR